MGGVRRGEERETISCPTSTAQGLQRSGLASLTEETPLWIIWLCKTLFAQSPFLNTEASDHIQLKTPHETVYAFHSTSLRTGAGWFHITCHVTGMGATESFRGPTSLASVHVFWVTCIGFLWTQLFLDLTLCVCFQLSFFLRVTLRYDIVLYNRCPYSSERA
jgi:hypothetical protein